MKKRILSLLLAALALALLAGCAGGGETETSDTVDMNKLQTAMLEADPSLPEMLSITSGVDDAARLFTYVSGLSYDKVDGYLLSYSATGTADEIAVIAVKAPADVNEAADSLRSHQQDRLNLFQTYGPDQAARVKKGEVFTQDQYAVLIICDDVQGTKDAFDLYLSDKG